ncbi:MAG TPA: VCBS repeat-containing protein, partial [Candidatus Polarisedimenticolia bacterium]|nr:VCBS repeat-containing protein [Candidatus Polarisedimenticolia bacterium]
MTHAPVFRGRRIDYEIEVPYQGGTRNLDMATARVGDFDGDGRPELLVANDPCYGLGGITLVRLRAEGGIGPVEHTPVNGTSSCSFTPYYVTGDKMTIGDFDGDRRVDVAFWRSGLLYRMTASGTFLPTPFSLPLDPTEGFQYQPYIMSADFNGDGLPDVVMSQPFFIIDFDTFNIRDSTNIYVFLADGQGGFRRSQKIEAPADPALDFRLIPISARDFNHDGKADLLSIGSGPLGTTEILLGDGAGHLSLPQAGLAVSPPLPVSPESSIAPSAVDDLNADHLPDLVYVVPGSGRVQSTIYLSTAPGRFATVQAQSDPLQSYADFFRTATVADLDEDGRQDVEVSGEGWTVPFLQLSNGQFRAGPWQRVPLRVNGLLRTRWDEDALYDRVYFGDRLPSDYTTTHPTLSVFLNHGSRNRDFADLDLSAERQPLTLKLRAGDFDGDHHQDIAVGTLDGIQVFRGDGRGGFLREVGFSGSFGVPAMVSGDWNEDGRTDLAFLRANASTSNEPGSVAIYLAQPGAPRFAAGVTVAVGPRPIKAVPVDLNRDGHLDLIVGGSGVTKPGLSGLIDGSAVSVLGDGHGGFAPSVPAYTLPPGYFNPEFLDVDSDDIDGDGVPDLILLVRSNMFAPGLGAWGPGHGDGTFEIPYYFGNSSTSAPARLLKPRDLNGDGITDLSLAPGWNGLYTIGRQVFLGTPDRDFHFTVASDCCAYAGEFTDLEGDGFLDLVARQDLDSLTVGVGSGTGEFLAEKTYYSPAGEYLTGAFERPSLSIDPIQADFDEDGRVDVVTLDFKGHATVLFNRSGRLASDPEESLAGAGTEPALDPRIDVLEIQGRPGAYDFGDEGGREGALVFTIHLERPEESEERAPVAARVAKDTLRGEDRPSLPPAPVMVQINFNFGELLKDTDGDGALDLSIANAAQEPGLAGT